MFRIKNYRRRIADDILKRKLEGKGAVRIKGPKWCGKTTTAEQLAASILYMDDPEKKEQNITVACSDNRIYCPVHWPLYSEIEKISSSTYINSHELSIPIDQRYSCNDMQYIVDTFQKREETNDSTYKLERKRKME